MPTGLTPTAGRPSIRRRGAAGLEPATRRLLPDNRSTPARHDEVVGDGRVVRSGTSALPLSYAGSYRRRDSNPQLSIRCGNRIAPAHPRAVPAGTATSVHSGWHGSRSRSESNRDVSTRFAGEPLHRERPRDLERTCARLGSNQRPSGSEPDALSAELRAHACASLVPTQVCPKAAALQAAGRAAVHDAHGVTTRSRTEDLQIHNLTCTTGTPWSPCPGRDSNPRSSACRAAALAAELPGPAGSRGSREPAPNWLWRQGSNLQSSG